jgi:phosphatidylglycerophosphatase A
VSGLSKALATVFGIGRIPIASGTFGSAAAIPFAYVLMLFGWQAIALAALAGTMVGVWACGKHCVTCNLSDPSDCVLDEVVGQWIALVPLAVFSHTLNWRAYLAGFLLFRLLDIAKLWPLSAAERLPGGYGVMADDVLAGIITAACLSAAMINGWV